MLSFIPKLNHFSLIFCVLLWQPLLNPANTNNPSLANERSAFPYSFDVPAKDFAYYILDRKPYDKLGVALQKEPLFAYLYAGLYEEILPAKKKHFKDNPLTGDTAENLRIQFLKKHKVNVQLVKGRIEYKHTVLGSKRPSQSALQTEPYWTPALLFLLKNTKGGLKNVELYLNFMGLYVLLKQGARNTLTTDMENITMPTTGSDFIALFSFSDQDIKDLANFARKNKGLWTESLFSKVYNLTEQDFSTEKDSPNHE